MTTPILDYITKIKIPSLQKKISRLYYKSKQRMERSSVWPQCGVNRTNPEKGSNQTERRSKMKIKYGSVAQFG